MKQLLPTRTVPVTRSPAAAPGIEQPIPVRPSPAFTAVPKENPHSANKSFVTPFISLPATESAPRSAAVTVTSVILALVTAFDAILLLLTADDAMSAFPTH